MTLWKAEPDPTNPGHWRIINASTLKTIVYGLSENSAREFADRRNKKQKKMLNNPSDSVTNEK